jgi:hypothetical protein
MWPNIPNIGRKVISPPAADLEKIGILSVKRSISILIEGIYHGSAPAFKVSFCNLKDFRL